MAQKEQLTVVVEAWTGDEASGERAIFSALAVAPRVVVAQFAELGVPYAHDERIHLVSPPFWGHLASWRNRVLDQITTPWVLWLWPNEEVVRLDRDRLATAIEKGEQDAFRVKTPMGRGESVRLFRVKPHLRFGGRLWPQIVPSLAEFSETIGQLDVRIEGEDSFPVAQAIASKLAEMPQHSGIVARAWAAWARGDLNRARTLTEGPLPRVPQLAALVAGLRAFLALEAGRLPEAFKVAWDGVRKAPKERGLWHFAGELALERKEYALARQAFARALGPDPGFPGLVPGVGSYRTRLGQAQAEALAGSRVGGIAKLVRLLEEYPRYRSGWQALLNLLPDGPAEERAAALGVLLPPDVVRRHFLAIEKPNPEELSIQRWYGRPTE